MKIQINKIKLNPKPIRPVNTKSEWFKEILESIKLLGMKYPILVDRKYYIMDGAHRYLVMKELGATEIEVVVKEDRCPHCDRK